MGVACTEDSGFSFPRNLSLWWSEETEYVLQRIERWAAYARGYNRLRSVRLSPGRMTMQEEPESRWSINQSTNRLEIEKGSWLPAERSRLRCCALGNLDYKSNGNLDSNCLEAYSMDHSIYFKTIGEIRSELRPIKEGANGNNMEQKSPATTPLDCGDFLSSDFDELDDEDENEPPSVIQVCRSVIGEDEINNNFTTTGLPKKFALTTMAQSKSSGCAADGSLNVASPLFESARNKSSFVVVLVVVMAKQLESVAAMACMTVFLMLFNFAFCCSGLVMLCVGIWMKLQLQEYADIGVESSGAALLALSFLGALVTLVGIIACCCTTRQHPALLYLYGAFLAVIALLELGAGASIYTYRNTLVEGFDRGLNESLTAYGTDNTKTFHVDLMQKTLHCCGNRAYTDWQNISPPRQIPTTCCSVLEGECDTTDIEDIYTEGCYNRVISFIKSNVGLVAGAALGVAVFPMLGVFLACCLASYINKVKYEQIA